LHPRVRQSALVGIGARGCEEPALIVEPESGSMPANAREREQFMRELRELARERVQSPAQLAWPEIDRVLYRRAFPMDVRHNAKIQREKLKNWAEEQSR